MLVRMVVIPAASETTDTYSYEGRSVWPGPDAFTGPLTSAWRLLNLEVELISKWFANCARTITKHQNKNKAKMPTNLFINNSPMLTTNHYPIIFISYNLCDYTKYNIQSVIGPLIAFECLSVFLQHVLLLFKELYYKNISQNIWKYFFVIK